MRDEFVVVVRSHKLKIDEVEPNVSDVLLSILSTLGGKLKPALQLGYKRLSDRDLYTISMYLSDHLDLDGQSTA